MLGLTTIIHFYMKMTLNNVVGSKHSPVENEIHWCECHGVYDGD